MKVRGEKSEGKRAGAMPYITHLAQRFTCFRCPGCLLIRVASDFEGHSSLTAVSQKLLGEWWPVLSRLSYRELCRLSRKAEEKNPHAPKTDLYCTYKYGVKRFITRKWLVQVLSPTELPTLRPPDILITEIVTQT